MFFNASKFEKKPEQPIGNGGPTIDLPDSLEEALPKNIFVRIHRSFIVAIIKIGLFTNETIQMAGNELTFSRTYRHEVEKIQNVYIGKLPQFFEVAFTNFHHFRSQ